MMASEHSITQAGQAVRRAVQVGRLPHVRTLTCVHCGEPAREYHHYLGHAKEHRLDVVPLCIPCHKRADSERRAEIKKLLPPKEKPILRQCEAITKAGDRCYFKTEGDGIYCKAHNQAINPIHYTELVPS